jgi:hypothetical protein
MDGVKIVSRRYKNVCRPCNNSPTVTRQFILKNILRWRVELRVNVYNNFVTQFVTYTNESIYVGRRPTTLLFCKSHMKNYTTHLGCLAALTTHILSGECVLKSCKANISEVATHTQLLCLKRWRLMTYGSGTLTLVLPAPTMTLMC